MRGQNGQFCGATPTARAKNRPLIGDPDFQKLPNPQPPRPVTGGLAAVAAEVMNAAGAHAATEWAWRGWRHTLARPAQTRVMR